MALPQINVAVGVGRDLSLVCQNALKGILSGVIVPEITNWWIINKNDESPIL